ncbi:MAG TPA: SDR family NAD(P)-dependent oxidoreductase [Sphingomicrobium sp.]|jgi:3-hydroxyacyl-CoA dehydrogenase/3a,7a,12a-trihydroxy-5b-cholest-24-enoyl-CoA hydratase
MGSNRAAIVTGAGNGLGAAFAKSLARAGISVLVNNRTHPDRAHSAQAVVDQIIAEGSVATADGNAVDAPGAGARLVDAAIAAFGRLDVLVLNAGISGNAVKIGAGDTALADVMAINFFANAALVEAALPQLLASPAGRIVFVSSTGGLHGVRGRAAYAASKGAMNAWALSLADELRRTNVRVNVIAPYAATNMTAQPGREVDDRMDPANAADALVWLCDPSTDRTGEIWVAGAGHVRAARAMEGRTARVSELPAGADALAAMAGAKSYPGGEAAFADFFVEATQERS